jgi:hypothetical protein
MKPRSLLGLSLLLGLGPAREAGAEVEYLRVSIRTECQYGLMA